MIQYYLYGHLPPRPDRVSVSAKRPGSETPQRRDERLTLSIDSQHKLAVEVLVSRPARGDRFPVIVAVVNRIANLPEIDHFVAHDFMFVQYQRDDLAPDDAVRPSTVQAAYPQSDGATLAIWAWGAMRVVDYLETRDDVECQQIAVTGHSRGGKAALLAGALDERFALVAPNGSGCGGAGCFRQTPTDAESLSQITDPQRFGYWFHPRLRWFAGQENRLPVDQHVLKALVAPRALLCTEAYGDRWANPSGTARTSMAAQAVFDWLGVSNKNGIHWREGAHDQTAIDWQALLDFAQWQFRNISPEPANRFRIELPSL